MLSTFIERSEFEVSKVCAVLALSDISKFSIIASFKLAFSTFSAITLFSVVETSCWESLVLIDVEMLDEFVEFVFSIVVLDTCVVVDVDSVLASILVSTCESTLVSVFDSTLSPLVVVVTLSLVEGTGVSILLSACTFSEILKLIDGKLTLPSS